MNLSIIVPVYNMAAEGKLNFCMDSLVAQTLPAGSYEILAVDDASTDNSLEILREYEARYPEKVRVFHYEVNRRQGGAKNEGLKHAVGEWIGFIDSDDWVTPDYYEKLLQKAQETGADLVGCDYSLVHQHTFQTGKVIRNNSQEQTGVLDREKHGKLLMRFGSMVIKIYKHSVIKENKLCFPEGIFYEDNCAGAIWSLYFDHFEKVEEPLYYYYQHQVSTVHAVTEEKCRDRMRSAELLYEGCKERGALEAYEKEVEYRFTELYFVNTLFSYLSGAAHPKIRFVRELYRGMVKYFPHFAENPYYQRETGPEAKKFIALLEKSAVLFWWDYHIKHWVWDRKK